MNSAPLAGPVDATTFRTIAKNATGFVVNIRTRANHRAPDMNDFFGGENPFDREFRRHLANVYRFLGLPIPGWLQQPIALGQETQRTAARGYITPPPDAAGQLPAAWTAAGHPGAKPAGIRSRIARPFR